MPRTPIAVVLLSLLAGCGASLSNGTADPQGAAEAEARLAASPRHGEWAMIPAGAGDSVRAWIVYPERADRAPVIVVVHEIFALTDWVRAVADQLAADGYVAVAPDFLTGRGVPAGANLEAARAAWPLTLRWFRTHLGG